MSRAWEVDALGDAPGSEPDAEPTGPVEPLGPVLPVLVGLTPEQRRIAVEMGRRMALPGRGPVLFVGGRVPGKRSLMAAAQAVAEQVLAGVPAMVVIDDPPALDPKTLADAVREPEPTGKPNRRERRREAALRRRGLR